MCCKWEMNSPFTAQKKPRGAPVQRSNTPPAATRVVSTARRSSRRPFRWKALSIHFPPLLSLDHTWDSSFSLKAFSFWGCVFASKLFLWKLVQPRCLLYLSLSLSLHLPNLFPANWIKSLLQLWNKKTAAGLGKRKNNHIDGSRLQMFQENFEYIKLKCFFQFVKLFTIHSKVYLNSL